MFPKESQIPLHSGIDLPQTLNVLRMNASKWETNDKVLLTALFPHVDFDIKKKKSLSVTFSQCPVQNF